MSRGGWDSAWRLPLIFILLANGQLRRICFPQSNSSKTIGSPFSLKIHPKKSTQRNSPKSSTMLCTKLRESPPERAVDKALKEVLPKALKAQKMVFFKRTLIRGAVFTFKPVIKDAMEGMRKSILYQSILSANSDLSQGDISALVDAYQQALMPRGEIISGKKEERSLEAIRWQLKKTKHTLKIPSYSQIHSSKSIRHCSRNTKATTLESAKGR